MHYRMWWASSELIESHRRLNVLCIEEAKEEKGNAQSKTHSSNWTSLKQRRTIWYFYSFTWKEQKERRRRKRSQTEYI